MENRNEIERVLEEKLGQFAERIVAAVLSGQHSEPGQLLSPKQAALYLDVKQQTLALWRTQSVGPNFFKIERSVKYRKADLDEYIKQQYVSH